jgi:hypothetical protein
MKKVFPLRVPGKADARVIEAVKHDVRKYVKRERRKTLPEGFGEWDFDCRVGASAAVATPTTLKEIGAAIDAVTATESTEVFIEILARATHRPPAPVRTAAPATTAPLDVPPAE